MRTFKIPKHFQANKVCVEVKGLSVDIKFYDGDEVLIKAIETNKDEFMWYTTIEKTAKTYTNGSHTHYIMEYICKQLNK